MNKYFILLLSLILFSCGVNKAELEQRAKHQAAASDRINESQSNTESLFKDMQ